MPKAKSIAPKLEFKKKRPFEFILEELGDLAIHTKPMFGCLAIYIDEKIVLILRKKSDHKKDNGVWLATTAEHHASLKIDFPGLRSIEMFGSGPTGWQNIAEDLNDFEAYAMLACKLIRKKDPRIGKIPIKRKIPKNKLR